jgi:hypothetical protein
MKGALLGSIDSWYCDGSGRKYMETTLHKGAIGISQVKGIDEK